MASFFVDAFFGFVANNADFFSGNLGVDDLSGNFYAFDFGGADGGFVTVDNQKSASFELFGAFREEVHP